VTQLKPRKPNSDFFEWFEEAAQNNTEAAEALDRLCRDFSDVEGVAARLHDLEHKGDGIVHSIYKKLNNVFMPPLDREDIIAIAGALDDVMDYIHKAADAMSVYNIKKPTSVACSLATVIVACTREVANQLPKLRQRKAMARIEEGVIEIHRLENEADRVVREAIASLFEVGIDPMVVIRWKDIFERLENAIDATERAAYILEGIVIKNA